MAFDNSTRNRLASLVGCIRDLLTREFDAQLQELYGIYAGEGRVLDLSKLPHLDDEKLRVAHLLRERIRHLAAGASTTPDAITQAVRRVLREQAFTVLNRFAALRMAEERGLIVEAVGGGLNSKGFKTFSEVAFSGLGAAYERYRLFLLAMFDEMSVDLGVLFDRRSPYGLLFPRENVLLEMFELINAPQVKPLWKGDETIGWIYQYFNDPAERKKMRDESTAPRNSRELAVRNQFFTPRYVVEFLTDNTLGRIWYEMSGGATSLREKCRYLVRRPNEIFLKPGEQEPPMNSSSVASASSSPPSEGGEGQDEVGSELSQEDLLKKPVPVPHRPLKDPRTILMLDPACGSMHFGLYAFDLFEAIYDEAWEIAKAGSIPPGADKSFSDFCLLTSDFSSKEEFLRQVPRLIIEHNLHGIDIDPRAAQIAGLSLWLRAQRAWKDMGLALAQRPAIKRSNIVCAEPMPGEKELLREFVEREFSAEERGVCLRLLEAIFDKMQLAGEAGSLLRIEEEIRSAIEDARRDWEKLREQLPGLQAPPQTSDLRSSPSGSDLRPLTSDFWETAESRLLAGLRDYAEQAETGGGYQRRLFAEDAARGFAFIDVCSKRYDVALMNPPFGNSAKAAKQYIDASYSDARADLYACFVQRGITILSESGSLGAITPRTGFFLSSFEPWRSKVLLKHCRIETLADLGYGVMDTAMVEAAAYCLSLDQRRAAGRSLFIRLLESDDKGVALMESILSAREGTASTYNHLASTDSFQTIPGVPFAYWVSERVHRLFRDFPAVGVSRCEIRIGLQTGDDFRFLRTVWEVPSAFILNVSREANFQVEADNLRYWCQQQTRLQKRWVLFSKGGGYSTAYADLHLVVDWGNDGKNLKASKIADLQAGLITENNSRCWNESHYFKPGLTYGRRVRRFSVIPIPAGVIFSDSSPTIFTEDLNALGWMKPYLSSNITRSILALLTAPRKIEAGYVAALPLPKLVCSEVSKALHDLGSRQFKRAIKAARLDESTAFFWLPSRVTHSRGTALETNISESEEEEFVDQTVCRLLGISEQERRQLVSELTSATGISDSTETDAVEVSHDSEVCRPLVNPTGEKHPECVELISYLFGVAIGRWDIRYATGEQGGPELPDPFAPLPVCPPGQLQNALGLPLTEAEFNAQFTVIPAPASSPSILNSQPSTKQPYPVRIPWDGILVDDPNHPLDIERRIREVIEIIWSDRAGGPTAEAIEHEACEILGVKSLSDYFRKPARFFADHLKRYSKSRRQAPIYWPLSTVSGSYTLWIYYQRLTDQTLFQCVNDFVKPKITEAEGDLARVMAEGVEQIGNRAEAERLTTLRAELVEFHDELLRVAQLPFKPNLNDGVLITAAPLWKLFRLPKWQKDLKACWQELERGDYDWAHLALTFWPDRIKAASKRDRSIAIAHGLEDLCEVQTPQKKKKKLAEKAARAGKSDPEPELPVNRPTERGSNPNLNPAEEPLPIDQTEREDVICVIRQIFSTGGARDRESAIKEIAAALGYRRTGKKIREVLHTDILTAVRRGILLNENGLLSLISNDIRNLERDSLKDVFIAAMGRNWTDREEAVRSFARFIGYARTGPVIEETARSLINGLIREGRLETDKEMIRKA